MHTCLDYAIESKADFILFQESFITNNNIKGYSIIVICSPSLKKKCFTKYFFKSSNHENLGIHNILG